MAYILYINGHEMELGTANPISQTRQVNDLAKLDNRQSSVTNKFTLPFTPKNVKSMEHVYLTGNQSNVPYQKNVASLYDAESGACLIYKGWATITQSSKKGYDVFIYDGLIDFYRRIENKTLTDCDVSGLNHAKSIMNIINSWGNLLPYIYAIADYNGKNEFVAQNGQNININTDFQVPSARVSYIWDRVFAFAGFTYSGSYFATQDFLNLFMSFPNPVKGIDIIINSITQQPPTRLNIVTYFSQGSLQNVYSYGAILPADINSPYMSGSGTGMQTPAIGTNTFKNILQTKTYRININCGWKRTFLINSQIITETTEYYYFEMKNNLGVTVQEAIFSKNQNFYFDGTAGYSFRIEVQSNANLPFQIFNALLIWPLPEQRYNLNPIPNFIVNPDGGYDITPPKISIDEYSGEKVLFSEALNEFNCTDFVKEVITRGALTAFKDKYSDHIEYLTMEEILQSNQLDDWSSKFQYKDLEKYKIGNYAKRNYFKYRYNSENETHNNGYIDVADENLLEENIIFNSKIYSPERDMSNISNQVTNVFKIWEKEIKENNIIEYKELTGKFYFLKFEKRNITTKIGSETLNLNQSVNEIGIANYDGVSFKKVVGRNYTAIASILDKGKVIDAYFKLSTIDIEKFNFKGLVYVEQLGSYYLVNKIINFVKGKVTKCELLEVDYRKQIIYIGPPPNTATYITIDSFTVVGCVVSVTYSTDATLLTPIRITCALPNFGLPVFTPPDPNYGYESIVNNTAVQNTFSFTLNAGSMYSMGMVIENVGTQNIVSNVVSFENTGTCLLYSPIVLVITSVTLINSYTETFFNTIVNVYKIDFNTDAPLPRNIFYAIYAEYIMSTDWGGYVTINATNNSITIEVGTFLQTATKVRLKIGNLVSNEFNL